MILIMDNFFIKVFFFAGTPDAVEVLQNFNWSRANQSVVEYITDILVK